MALDAENRAQLERLRDASPASVAALVGLTAAILIVNGLVFWAVLAPVRRLRAVDVCATSCIATFLALLPFKLSLAARIAIHHKRDGVPLMMIGGWLGAVGVLFVGSIGVVAGAAFGRARFEIGPDPAILIGLVGLAAFGLATVIGARLFAGPIGLERIRTLILACALGPLRKPAALVTGSHAFGRLHRAFEMLGSPAAVVAALALRVVDVALQAGRFAVAGALIGLEVDIQTAVLLACAHASIGVLSPFGTLGTREAGTLALAAAFGLAAASGEAGGDTAGLSVVLLVVGAVDGVTALAMAAMGVAWLRPDRLFRKNKAPQDAPSSASPSN